VHSLPGYTLALASSSADQGLMQGCRARSRGHTGLHLADMTKSRPRAVKILKPGPTGRPHAPIKPSAIGGWTRPMSDWIAVSLPDPIYQEDNVLFLRFNVLFLACASR